MNLPMENRPQAVDDRLVDRLVDGELPDVERRELLVRFETEPDGWRRCALAFLEAQNWRQALGSLVISESRMAATESSKPRRPLPSPRPWHVLGRLTGLAAGLAAAFALGWAVERNSFRSPAEDVSERNEFRSKGSSDSEQSVPEKLVMAKTKPSKSAKHVALFDPLVKRLEQQGYSVETEERLISVAGKDGRKVNVPVQEVRLRNIRNQTY